MLVLLARYRVRATFSLIGTSARARPDLVRRIVGAGHGVCNHSMTQTTAGPLRCPVGSLAAVMHPDPDLRPAAADAFTRWLEPLTSTIRHLQTLGAMRRGPDVVKRRRTAPGRV